jgi:hypothetical protein
MLTFRLIRSLALALLAAALAVFPPAARPADTGPTLHSKCAPMPTDLLGPFARLGDGTILAIDGDATRVSKAEGKTWSEPRPLFAAGQGVQVSSERALLRTRDGVLILAFMNMKEYAFKWDPVQKDAPGARLPTYVVRSLDDGKTWQDMHKLHDEYTGAIRDMIQTREGRVVFTSMQLFHDPGRHTVLTYASADNGKSWKRSNLIDLGGTGHHGGATEGTLEQLKDGRLWMLIRTNWGKFWEAFSEDDGLSWRTIRPSAIAASSAPGLLKRLKSGRLMLLWNRPYPEGKSEFPLTGGDGQWSEVPVSNHRGELAVAFSSDEGATWSRPIVVARLPGKWVAYPYIFEARPGEVWITTMQGGARVLLHEADFAGPAVPKAAGEPTP